MAVPVWMVFADSGHGRHAAIHEHFARIACTRSAATKRPDASPRSIARFHERRGRHGREEPFGFRIRHDRATYPAFEPHEYVVPHDPGRSLSCVQSDGSRHRHHVVAPERLDSGHRLQRLRVRSSGELRRAGSLSPRRRSSARRSPFHSILRSIPTLCTWPSPPGPRRGSGFRDKSVESRSPSGVFTLTPFLSNSIGTLSSRLEPAAVDSGSSGLIGTSIYTAFVTTGRRVGGDHVHFRRSNSVHVGRSKFRAGLPLSNGAGSARRRVRRPDRSGSGAALPSGLPQQQLFPREIADEDSRHDPRRFCC